jgi:SAM-dependent methyltransferase
MTPTIYSCQICDHQSEPPQPRELGSIRGNTARFMNSTCHLWQCPQCQTIHNVDPVDFADIYSDYPLNQPRKADVFSLKTMGNLLRRLERAGIKKNAAILDFGCGNGMFVAYLHKRGYENVTGYDPYVVEFAREPDEQTYDCVVANDVIEHIPLPGDTFRGLVKLLKPGGILYIGMPEPAGVAMDDLESHMMRLHQPFHRVIFTAEALKALGEEEGLELLESYRRSYLDTLAPFANYRFLDEFNRAVGYNMDKALDPSSARIMLRKPRLWFFALFGYWFPTACEPAMVMRKP